MGMGPKGAVLETPRLRLREMGMEDLDFIAELLGDPVVMRYWPRPYARDEAADWICRQQQRYARDGHGYWLAVEKASGRAVGQVGLLTHRIDEAEEVGLGYIIHRPFWRRGLATEAAAACRDHAFDALHRARVICLIRPENVPSQAVARKLGMTPGPTVLHAGLPHVVWAVRADDAPRRPPPPDRARQDSNLRPAI